MVDKLKGKTAVVTGSGQGIGKAIALALATEGARVVTNNRTAGAEGGDAEATAAEIKAAGGESVACFGDISDFATAEQLIKTAVDSFGSMDILVNNAGADAPKMVWKMAEEDWDRCLNSFLKGSFLCIRHAAPLMRERKWGRIINTTSTAWLGTVGHCNYGAAKAGIVGLTRAVAREMGRSAVTCNAIAPLAATRFTLSDDVKAGLKKRLDAGLLTREKYDEMINLPKPDVITPFIVYLGTEEAGDINGQVFDTTGNTIAIYSEPVKIKTISKDEKWTVEELIEKVPSGLLEGYKNPAPPQKEKGK